MLSQYHYDMSALAALYASPTTRGPPATDPFERVSLLIPGNLVRLRQGGDCQATHAAPDRILTGYDRPVKKVSVGLNPSPDGDDFSERGEVLD